MLSDDNNQDVNEKFVENKYENRHSANFDNNNNNNNNDLKSDQNDEIVASNPSEKSWKGIAIAILVILAISGVIILAIYITSPEIFHGPVENNIGTKFTFRDFFLAGSKKRHLVSEWIGENYLSYVDEDHDRKLLNLSTFYEEDVILKTYIEEKMSSSVYIKISQDSKYMFLSYNHNANFRHSETAQYSIYELKNVQKTNELGVEKNAALQNAEWSSTGHYIAFVFKNHLYYTSDPMDNSKITPITKNLSNNTNILYGVADWLYEEEIFRVSKSFWWSPKSKFIAFVAFNDDLVQDYTIKVFGNANDPNINGEFINIKYPKAGQSLRSNNPLVKVYVYNLLTKQNFQINKPPEIPEDYYVCMVKWIDDETLLLGWMNREQTRSWLSLARNWADPAKTSIDNWVIYEEKVENGWSDMLKQKSIEPLVNREQRKLLIILNRITKSTEYRNIAELNLNYTPNKMAVKKWLVTADFDFTDIIHQDNSYIYFTGNRYGDAKQLHLFKADKSSGQFSCMSCDDELCEYNQYDFKPDGQYFIQSCLGPDVPHHKLYKINNNGTFIYQKHLINNTELREKLQNKSMPVIEFQKIAIKTNDRKILMLESKIMLPKTLNKKHVTKYPLLLSVYAGPSSQLVTKKFSIDWHTYLVSSLGIVVLFVDGRGTANQGRAFERAVYKKLGDVEIHDQLHAALNVSKFSYINQSQIGAYGWSYGGFTVGHLMGHPDNPIIRCGISVAPVTSFDYYDTAYTERYLGLKENDKTGIYQTTDYASKVRNFSNKSYLLVHGTKDDNVHFLNSARLIRSLVNHDIMFDVMVYPDEAHGLMGGRTHIHVFRKMTSFLINCYNKTSIEYRLDLFK